MALELLRKIGDKNLTLLRGLELLADSAFSVRQNMEQRVKTPIIEDGTELWQVWLDSKTMQIYGGCN